VRVAVVEPYLGGSHASWALGYQQHSRHDIVVLSHTDRFWKWRMHGAHVTLAQELEREVDRNGPVDLVVGSSMLNGAGFLGLARRTIGDAAFVIYMHENQLGYPLSPRDRADLSYPMINWTSMAVADLVIFNSDFHRREWFEEVPRFLRQFPDYQQQSFVPAVERRSIVLPVGVDLRRFDDVASTPGEVARIVWNQRWEYDKGTQELATAIRELVRRGVEFELILAGEQFPTDPEEFVQLRNELGDRLIHYGWAEPDEYVRLLASSDIVVSTAHHEFFGIAITEAVYAGAFPVLPNRLVYPERIPARFHGRCLYETSEEFVAKIEWAVANRSEAAEIAQVIGSHMTTADWSLVATQYDEALAAIAAGKKL
jgi:glycosyltransferase involved in cell wall biosynthesis